ncbi:hypothetical protein chiPu_0009075 [Chiloscyllium punctatum]|uniref:Uncharacterized protein n=1 Tax=Chiloscyllium punctatum TaxID=137246 RepID=A0A401SJM7_CHIPU|nr:hypothetical protein [Chiloscyllium punctatum]
METAVAMATAGDPEQGLCRSATWRLVFPWQDSGRHNIAEEAGCIEQDQDGTRMACGEAAGQPGWRFAKQALRD